MYLSKFSSIKFCACATKDSPRPLNSLRLEIKSGHFFGEAKSFNFNDKEWWEERITGLVDILKYTRGLVDVLDYTREFVSAFSEVYLRAGKYSGLIPKRLVNIRKYTLGLNVDRY